MAYAPDSLKWLFAEWDKVVGSAVFSGIVGDSAHNRGYHRSANEVPANDYSRQLEADRVGIDWDAASALDVSMNQADMKRVTKLLYDSWRDQNDLRLNYVREVIGTLDGSNVIYMDCQSGERGSSDSSHLWHIHVGFLRKYATDRKAAEAVLSIVQGKSYAEYLGNAGGDEDMALADYRFEGRDIPTMIADIWAIAMMGKTMGGPHDDSFALRRSFSTEQAAIQARDNTAAILVKLTELEVGQVNIPALVDALVPVLGPELTAQLANDLAERIKE